MKRRTQYLSQYGPLYLHHLAHRKIARKGPVDSGVSIHYRPNEHGALDEFAVSFVPFRSKFRSETVESVDDGFGEEFACDGGYASPFRRAPRKWCRCNGPVQPMEFRAVFRDGKTR